MSANQYSAQPGRLTIHPDAQAMIDVARKEGIETVKTLARNMAWLMKKVGSD